jgi:hypothetical protein
MYRFIAGIIISLVAVLLIQLCVSKKEEKQELTMNTALIQQQINQVGKLVVTEGHFSQVVSYRNTRRNYFDIFSANKKALVIVNAKVTVGYDLRQVMTEIDEQNRTVRITYIPEPEINIYPDIEYYDITQDYLNKFGAEDYNKIKTRVQTMMEEKINQSHLKENAKERLVSELSKIYILTASMGWTLQYREEVIDSIEGLDELILN